MKRTYAWRDGRLVEVTTEVQERIQIMEDVEEFRNPDGTRISGRAQWREHLKATDSVELGHSDMHQMSGKWTKRREQFQERVRRDVQNVYEANPSERIEPAEISRIEREMANRLDNRPTPDRKTLIRMTIETMKQLKDRR